MGVVVHKVPGCDRRYWRRSN